MARITLDVDASGLIAGQRRARNSTEELNREFDKVLDTNKALERQVKQMWDQSRPALERYTDKVRRLRQLEKEGSITQKQMQMAIDRTRESYRRQQAAARESFGNRSLMMVRNYAAQIGAVALSVNTVRDALQRLDEERLESANQFRSEKFPGLGALGSLTEDPQQLNRLFRFVDQAQAGGVAADQAGAMVFQLESAGMLTRRNVDMLSQASVSGLIGDLPAVSQAAATMMANMGGTLEDTLDIMAAGAQQTKTMPAEFLQAMSEGAQQAKELGLSRQDLAAMAVATTQTARSGAIGGTQLRSFLTAVEKTRGGEFDVTGRTSNEILENIQGLMKEGFILRDILGDRQEAIDAARVLMGQEDLAETRRGIAAGMTGDTFQKRINNLAENERIGVVIRNKQLEQQQNIINEELGLLKLRQQNAQMERENLMRAADPLGRDLGQRFGATRAMEAASFLGASPESVAAAGGVGRLAAQGTGLDALGGLINGIDRMVSWTRRTATNTQPRPNTNRPAEN